MDDRANVGKSFVDDRMHGDDLGFFGTQHSFDYLTSDTYSRRFSTTSPRDFHVGSEGSMIGRAKLNSWPSGSRMWKYRSPQGASAG